MKPDHAKAWADYMAMDGDRGAAACGRFRETVSALAEAGFTYEHTAGDCHVWQREHGPMTVYVGCAEDPHFQPESPDEPVVILVWSDPHDLTFRFPTLRAALASLAG